MDGVCVPPSRACARGTGTEAKGSRRSRSSDADFDLDDYSVVVKHRAPPFPGRGGGRFTALGSGSRSNGQMSFSHPENASLAGREAFTRLMARLAKMARSP
jgi:hypothetical protein